MLTELSDMQKSDERIWGATRVSFTIETRSDEDNEIVHRKYTFAHAKEWDKWTFQEYEEKRTEDSRNVIDRTWRRTEHRIWSDSESPDIEIPQEVTTQLEEMLELDELTLQTPGEIV